MILLLDAGNTRLKWRVIDPQQAGLTTDEGALDYARLDDLTQRLGRFPAIRHAVGSNVAGEEVARRIATLLPGIVPQWLRASSHCCGVYNHYTEPAQLGTDRWAALIGARRVHAGPCLVVSAGTATTIDLLDAAGHFRGGLILPGVDLMRRSLAGNTAQLPLADGTFVWQPRSTVDAIESGCLQAQAGAVERMFVQIADTAGALCLLGGGAADRFAHLLTIPVRRVDNLVLHGLAGIATTSDDIPPA